ncbi:hypothetical protein GQ53DRAFT_638436 [Thozetella sp. PMI_491]|nr:hypothetical protein GQ53DRAFT_638436 [Thozetella sp. PMI_491]
MSEVQEPGEADVSAALSESENEYDEHDPDSQLKDELDKMDGNHASPDADGNGEVKKKYDPKDPMRPRRKKARRACYACQRAHLTCGDERPCQRCIKRGLADACQDGVRKKAKYLHDAPPEALRDVLGPSFDQKPQANRPNNSRHQSNSGSEASTNNVPPFFSPSQSNTSGFPTFSTTTGTPMATIQDALPFGNQPSPVSPTFQAPTNPLGGITVPQVTNEMAAGFTPALFDPSNPALFNFNLEGLNFGSQYGAMEFGMLGHMSSGAAQTPPRDPSISQQGSGDATFSSVYGNGAGQFENKVYENGSMVNDFLGLDQNGNGIYSQGNLQHGLPHAYAIAAGPSSLQSPSTENNSPQPTTFGFEGSPTTATYSAPPGAASAVLARPKAKATLARIGPQSVLGKRQRDPSYIYESVKEPFPYVSSFHSLIAHVQKRFSKDQSLRIAKALASIRSPLISCMRTLNRLDLVFMEKSFQRALFEYEDFMLQCSSPAIACRRSGELAGVNKEFTALTGWTKEVLLGKEPNLNVNTGSGLRSGSSSGKGGLTTPQLRGMNSDPAADRPDQPVFLAELMDDDSVIEFYEDYAHLAFNDSRGKVYRKCRLLKYRTQANIDAMSATVDETLQKDPRSSILSNRVAKIDGEHGISKLEKDGRLECSYTFAIKRDTFDIPMMIIVNFLPCYYRNHNQLAV